MVSRANRLTRISLITYGAFLAFFLFGFADNLKGPILPALLDDLALSYSTGGTIVMGAYLGFLIATLLTGPLSDTAGNKVVIFVACACLSIGAITFSTASATLMLAASMTIVGLGLGAIEVGGNLIIVDLYQDNKGRYLNLLAFFHGVGSMLAPLYAGTLLNAGTSWRTIYQSITIVVVVLFVYFILIRYPRAGTSEGSGLDLKKIGRSAFTGKMILFYATIAMYVAVEIGIGAWLVEFLQKVNSQSVMMSSLYLSLFFGAVTAGRFIGSFLVERMGYLKSMLYTSIAAMICLALGIFAPPGLSFFLPLAGFFLSIIFPTATAAVSDLHQENVGTILGLLFTFAGVGGMLGSWSVGIVSDWVGIHLGFGMVLVFCIGMCITFSVLIKISPDQNTDTSLQPVAPGR
jgi:FHS family glucose/mannose:H+ symporter-like MFS transporter